MRVLLLAADRLQPEFLRRPIVAAGHRCETVLSWDELEHQAERQTDEPPQLVLVPARLGADEGPELARRVKARYAAAVIIYGPGDPIPREPSSPFDGFLKLPFASAELTSLLGVATRERKLILLADDSELIHRQNVPLLESAGYDVLSARDGNEALHIAFERKSSLSQEEIDSITEGLFKEE